jgi:hypothetical protein
VGCLIGMRRMSRGLAGRQRRQRRALIGRVGVCRGIGAGAVILRAAGKKPGACPRGCGFRRVGGMEDAWVGRAVGTLAAAALLGVSDDRERKKRRKSETKVIVP